MDLGGFANGLSQGMDSASLFMARKQAMEKQRLEIDEQKRQMAARAAMFGQQRPGPTGLPGSGQMPQPLPGMQGQPPSMLTRAGNWLTNQIGGFGGGQGGQQGGGNQMGMVDAPPLPKQGTDGLPAPSGIGPWAGDNMPKPVGNAGDGGGHGGGADDFSLEGLDRHLQSIAGRIRQNNPGIDDETLGEAVTQYVQTMAKVGAISGPEQRYFNAMLNNQTRRDVADQGNTTKRDIAGANNQTRRDLGAQSDATKRRGQDVGRENVLDRVREQRWSAELSSQWHLRGQDMTHDDRQASIAAGLERTRTVQDGLNQRFSAGQIDKANWQAAGQEVRAVTAKMNAAQRIMNGIMNANPDSDPSTNPQYKQAASDYEAAAAKLDFIEQKLDETAPADKTADKPADAGGKPAPKAGGLPKDLPSPKGVKEGTKARDGKGNVVAILKAGQWVAP